MRSKFAFILSIPTAPPKRSLRSRMEKKGKLSKPWWGWKHHWAIWEYHLRRSSSYVFICKNYKNSKYASYLDSDAWVSKPFHFSTTQGNMVDTSKIYRYEEWHGITFMLASHVLKSCFMVTCDFARGRAKIKCGGTCWQSLSAKYMPSTPA